MGTEVDADGAYHLTWCVGQQNPWDRLHAASYPVHGIIPIGITAPWQSLLTKTASKLVLLKGWHSDLPLRWRWRITAGGPSYWTTWTSKRSDTYSEASPKQYLKHCLTLSVTKPRIRCSGRISHIQSDWISTSRRQPTWNLVVTAGSPDLSASSIPADHGGGCHSRNTLVIWQGHLWGAVDDLWCPLMPACCAAGYKLFVLYLVASISLHPVKTCQLESLLAKVEVAYPRSESRCATAQPFQYALGRGTRGIYNHCTRHP